MSICKRCGCEFEYSMKNGTGYAPDLCGAFCDGVYSERKVSALKIAGLMTQIDELRDERDALAAELDRLRQALAYKPGACRMLSLGDDCDCTLCKQSKEIARLRTLEAALPKTADGVPIVYGGTYWVMSDEDDEPWIGEITVRDIEGPHRLTKGRWLVCGSQFEAWDDELYSTLEAAREAEKARDA